LHQHALELVAFGRFRELGKMSFQRPDQLDRTRPRLGQSLIQCLLLGLGDRLREAGGCSEQNQERSFHFAARIESARLAALVRAMFMKLSFLAIRSSRDRKTCGETSRFLSKEMLNCSSARFTPSLS